MTSPSPSMTELRERFVMLTLAGEQVADIALAIGVPEKRLLSWRQEPWFVERIEAAHQETWDRVYSFMHSKAMNMAKRLVAIAEDETASHMAQVQAVRVFMELLGKHKNNPVTKTVHVTGLETPEQIIAALAVVPSDLLEAALKARQEDPSLRLGADG